MDIEKYEEEQAEALFEEFMEALYGN